MSTRVDTHARDAGGDSRIAQAFDADETKVLAASDASASLTITRLASEVASRLRSTGGRPSDPNWTMTRQVPFAVSTWAALGQLAEDLSARGRRVAPTQLAAMLVESGLKSIEDAEPSSPAALDRHLQGRDAPPESNP